MMQTLGSFDLPSMLEPRGLYRTDSKRTDGVTTITWEMGKQLVWDVKVVDALVPSCLNQRSLCNTGTIATEAEARWKENIPETIDNQFNLQPVVLAVQGYLCESSEISITSLARWSMNCPLFEAKELSGSSDRQCGLCFRNCERLRCAWRNSLLWVISFKYVYNCRFFETCFYRSTGLVSRMSSLLVVFCCYWFTGKVAGMGFLLSLQTTGVCHLPHCDDTHDRHLIDDEDQWCLIVKKTVLFKGCRSPSFF